METIGIENGDVDTRDPFALIERIRYLVRHEHTFADKEAQLRDLAASRAPSSEWDISHAFLRLLDRYHLALKNGGFDVDYFRREVADFGLHLHAIQEPS